jgi:hypothetical protein
MDFGDHIPPVFFYIHIWKTGGTSFFNICSDNFGNNFHRDNMLIQNWFLSVEQLRFLLEYHSWIQCYSCHMLSGNLPYDHESREVVGIAFVRNPVNRFISSYNFQRGRNYRGGIAKENDFCEFAGKALEKENNPWWKNGQTFVLGGLGTQKGLEVVAEHVKKGELILLPTERFDESCVLLEHLFPANFKECSYTPLNISRKSKPISDEQRAKVAAHMDLDLELVNLANNYLDRMLHQIFPDSNQLLQSLNDFQIRCEKKKRNKRWAYIVKNYRVAFKKALAKLNALNC